MQLWQPQYATDATMYIHSTSPFEREAAPSPCLPPGHSIQSLCYSSASAPGASPPTCCHSQHCQQFSDPTLDHNCSPSSSYSQHKYSGAQVSSYDFTNAITMKSLTLKKEKKTVLNVQNFHSSKLFELPLPVGTETLPGLRTIEL